MAVIAPSRPDLFLESGLGVKYASASDERQVNISCSQFSSQSMQVVPASAAYAYVRGSTLRILCMVGCSQSTWADNMYAAVLSEYFV